jgi:hypothetical protein
MSLESDIYTALRSLVGDRVYPLVLPQGAGVPITPAIRYQFISSEVTLDICGDGGDAVANTRTQVDVYSTTYMTARALRLQVIAAMTSMSTPTVLAGGFDDYEPDMKLYRCSIDFISHPSS